MKFLLKFILAVLAVVACAYFLPGIYISGYATAFFLVLVLAVLNVLLKPLLIVFTIPITVLTFGLFLFVINALLILVAELLVPGFSVDGFWWALVFSLILSGSNSLIDAIIDA